MKSKKMTFPLVVEPFQEDYSGHLSWSNLGNFTLRIASLHAEAHGFGISYMMSHRRGWVLSRLAIEFQERPRSLQHYSIATWVSRIFRQFTERNFEFRDDDGCIIGHGISTWALIDYETRQPVNLENLPNGGFQDAVLSEVPPIAPYSRIRVKEPSVSLHHHCGMTDLDINGHVNSIRYIDWVLDAFPLEWHKAHTVHRIEAAFGLEGYAGDEVDIIVEAVGENAYAAEIKRQSDGATLVKVMLYYH